MVTVGCPDIPGDQLRKNGRKAASDQAGNFTPSINAMLGSFTVTVMLYPDTPVVAVSRYISRYPVLPEVGK
jgi:hypothetical protein